MSRLDSLRAAVRFDGAFWRRLAELGCVYGPEWWKRGSPPVIAAIIYAIAHRQRTVVRANQRLVRGPLEPLREHWESYLVFAEFARSVTETLEQWGPRPKAIEVRSDGDDVFRAALAEGRGVVVVTGHFGSWAVATRALARFDRKVNVVNAREINATARDVVHEQRTRHGYNVIYSGDTAFSGVPIVQALRRGEIVGMQIEPWGPLPGSHAVDFCGQPTRFQLGPFTVARIARAPLLLVFGVRRGIRRHELRLVARFDPRTHAQSVAALEASVHAYEAIVREQPRQWLMFQPMQGDDAAVTPAVRQDENAMRAS